MKLREALTASNCGNYNKNKGFEAKEDETSVDCSVKGELVIAPHNTSHHTFNGTLDVTTDSGNLIAEREIAITGAWTYGSRLDRSFNKAILSALKDKTPVFIRKINTQDWKLLTSQDFYLSDVFDYEWSLLKPKEKKKTKVEVSRWMNMYSDGFCTRVWSSKEEADVIADSDRLACVELKGEYEVEE